MTTTSNESDVTEAAAAPFLSITASPSTLPASGGLVTIAGTTNLTDGTVVTLVLGGAPTTETATTASGAFSFTYTAAANLSLNPVTLAFTCTA
jgi:hypothetical protein